VLLVVAIPLAAYAVMSGGTRNPLPTASAGASAATGSGGSPTGPAATASAVVGGPGTPSAPSTPQPPGTFGRRAIVPITNFRAPHSVSDLEEVAEVLAGTSSRYDALRLVADEADSILAALGMARPTDPSRLATATDAATLATDLAANRRQLAFVRADEVGPSVRVLAWGRHSLFGGDRVATLGDWPLHAELPDRAPGATPYDPAAAWTLVAGGDILLDRGVYKTIKLDGKGVDFPFDGGTAEITSRYCCSSMGWDLPRTQRTGNEGAVRSLIEGADISIANFENPAPDRFTFHTRDTTFTADPALIAGLANAGIDWVSLANNHIRDAGGQGVLETIENLEARGLRHGGAGENAAAAHTATILDAGGVQVGILGYDAIAAGSAAGPDRIGSAQLSAAACRTDIAAARSRGADVVIVFPHWGAEYDPTPFDGQQELARACLDAGADMIIGNHAHWAGAIEVHDGKPIWYALGNFVFDQVWSEPTMEGITLELTFSGTELRQIRMRPHIILDRAQPNFMDANGSGKVVMGQVFGASDGLLDW